MAQLEALDDFELDDDFQNDFIDKKVLTIIGRGIDYFKNPIKTKSNQPSKVQYIPFDKFLNEMFKNFVNGRSIQLREHLRKSTTLIESIHRYKDRYDKEPRQDDLYSLFMQGKNQYDFDPQLRRLLETKKLKWFVCLEPYNQIVDVLSLLYTPEKVIPIDITRLDELDPRCLEDDDAYKVVFPFGYFDGDHLKEQSPHLRTWPRIDHTLDLLTASPTEESHVQLTAMRTKLKDVAKSILYLGCDYNEWEVSIVLNSVLGINQNSQTKRHFASHEKLVIDDSSHRNTGVIDFYADIRGKVMPELAETSKTGAQIFEKLDHLITLLERNDDFNRDYTFDTRVFLAYSNYEGTVDYKNKIRAFGHLLNERGIRIWIDDAIREGQIPDKVIEKAIEDECEFFVFCLPLLSEFNTNRPEHYMLEKELKWAFQKVRKTKIGPSAPPSFLFISREELSKANTKDKNITTFFDKYNAILKKTEGLTDNQLKTLEYKKEYQTWNDIVVFDQQFSIDTVRVIYNRLAHKENKYSEF